MANRTQKQLHTSRERRLRDLKPAPHKFPIVGLYATELRQHASRPAAQWQAKTQCVALRPVYRSPHWKQVLRCAPSTTRQSRIYRSEEHTSELQSRGHLVCRLLLEKKNPK